MRPLPAFDGGALFKALDQQRRGTTPLCGGAIQRLQERGATPCQ